MNIDKLPVDYVQDVIDTSVTSKRKYILITNADGTTSLDDVTVYVLKGSDFGADDINTTNGTINDIIDAIENILNGSETVKNAEHAEESETAKSSERAEHAETSETSKSSQNANTADKLKTAVYINGVEFDGSKNISVYDNTKLSVDKDFVLANKQVLNFENNICTIQDERITADSLADVYFTSDCIDTATSASISVETYEGELKLTAEKEPEGIINASIHIRVV